MILIHVLHRHWRMILIISVIYWTIWKLLGIFTRWDLLTTPLLVTLGVWLGHVFRFWAYHMSREAERMEDEENERN